MVLARYPTRLERLLKSPAIWALVVAVVAGFLSLLTFWRAPATIAPPTTSTTSTAGPRPVNSTAVDAPEPFERVRVFYATDRQPLTSGMGYGHVWSEELRYGIAEVSMPHDHRLGVIESPSVWRLEFRRNPAKHVYLHAADEVAFDSFSNSLRTALTSSGEGHALVFVHGFNVSFDAAVMRTAQIFTDLSLPGVPIAYVWPSRAELGPIAYVADSNMADVTAPHLKQFLLQLAGMSDTARIHIIAHSMGNKVVARAIEAIAADRAVPAKKYFQNIALTAPDLDERVLKSIAGNVGVFAVRTTLYASANDEALNIAAGYTKSRRAGQAGPGILVVPPIDTVDASTVDTSLVGHFYYGSNLSVLSDIYYLVRSDEPPDRRFLLRPVESPRGKYWEFRRTR